MSANTKMVLIPLDRYEELTLITLDNKTIKKEKKDTLKEKQPDSDNCTDSLTVDNILEFIPADFRNKAKLILRHLKAHDISWDNCGRLVLDNDCVVDANIIEIIKDVVTTNNNKIESKSSKHFYKLLILTNFPVSLLNLRDGSNTESGGEKDSDESLL
jgi:hypothetical protein